ncbi:MAG: diaminopimelate epimerase [Coriobacteriales bacterium]|jgi:diaminopimelate epimerase|nr:diaminopimelate epimerase [Coriobacteriales bacterium]
MELDFTKMHGTSNDFVVIDDLSEEHELSEEQVRFICDRHRGVGADGLILVRPPRVAGSAAYMHYLNHDGSLAEMCGNGVRCLAKYLVDRGFVAAREGQLVVDTLVGKRAITFTVDGADLLLSATVDMGEPILEPMEIPTTLKANSTTPANLPLTAGLPMVAERELDTPLGKLAFTCLSMGNPHAVTFLNNPDDSLYALDISQVGPAMEQSELFPQKANIGFAQVRDPGGSDRPAELDLRVWERGVGETLACGTGACAAVAAAALTGRIVPSALVRLRGGDLRIEWRGDGHLMMEGPAATVYEGTIRL